MLELLKVKTIGEQRITVYKDSDNVEECYREVELTGLNGSECYNLTLSGDDALIPLKVDQKLMVDLRWHSFKMNGVWYDDYSVASLKPLDNNAQIEYVEDWTNRLV